MKSNSIGFDARARISMKPTPAPLLGGVLRRLQFLLVQRLQPGAIGAADLFEPGAQAGHVLLHDQIAGLDAKALIRLADRDHAVADLERHLPLVRPGELRLLLGRIADDVLHLLDEHGEHAAQGFGVRLLDHHLLLERLADAAQDALVHVAAVAEHDPSLAQEVAQAKQILGEHARLLSQPERGEAKHGDIVPTCFVALVSPKHLAEDRGLIGHRPLMMLRDELRQAALAERPAARAPIWSIRPSVVM